MTEFYSQIKCIHIAAAVTSGTLLFLRGLAAQSANGGSIATSELFC
jgi:hypothetical protein